MRIFAFIEQYCRDLVDEHNLRKDLFDLTEYPHDDVVEDVEGRRVPVVLVDNEAIPVSDFFTLEKKDFLEAWKLQSAEAAYDNYLDAVEILEGSDAVYRVRNILEAEAKRLEQECELVTCL